MGQVLLIPFTGVLRGQASHYRRDLSWGSQIFGGAAHDHHIVSAFQVHDDARVCGKIAGLDSAALAVEVQDVAEHYSHTGAACGAPEGIVVQSQ